MKYDIINLSITTLVISTNYLIWNIIMDKSDPRQYTKAMRFWDAFRACVEENRIDSTRSVNYVKWAQAFYRFFPKKGLGSRTKEDIEAFLADIGKQPDCARWQVKQAEYAICVPCKKPVC